MYAYIHTYMTAWQEEEESETQSRERASDKIQAWSRELGETVSHTNTALRSARCM
jgi:hypothetical protein